MKKVNWKSIQENSDSILADGLWQLSKRPFEDCIGISHNSFGNYLISHEKKPYYIGETKDVGKRLKQQFKPTTSTFFKNFQKYIIKNNPSNNILIDNFRIQHIPTQLGRKEVEEFGIVNLPTILNGFQLGKRKRYEVSCNNGIWDQVQTASHELLMEGAKDIANRPYTRWFDNFVIATAGLYVVKNKENELIYIGESSNVKERHLTHSSDTYFSALRRHIATEILSFELKEINGKKKYLSETEDKAVSAFLKNCYALFYPLNLGRYELEEHLIKHFKPLLNRKDNRKD